MTASDPAVMPQVGAGQRRVRWPAAVYVDAAVHPWRGRMWCHLFACDLDRLHGFAARLGLRREWFQQPPGASWPHYDITAARRARAVHLGALEADRVDLVVISQAAGLWWAFVDRPDLVPVYDKGLQRRLAMFPAWSPPEQRAQPRPVQGRLFDA